MTTTVFKTRAERWHFERLRWTSVTLLTAGFMVAFFHRMAPAVLADELRTGFQASAVALGALSAIYYYVYTAMQIPAGILADTLGPRRNVAVMSLVAGLGSIVFALAPNLTIAGLGRFLVGFGVSTAFIGLMKHNANWFSEHRYAAISGFVMLLGNLGAVLAAAPLAALLTLASWRTIFIGAGLFSFVLAALIWFFVRDRPEDAGLPNPRELPGMEPVTQYSQHWFHSLREVFMNRALWPVVLFFFGLLGNGLAFAGLWAVPMIEDRFGLEGPRASAYLTVNLICFALSSYAAGWLSDRIGRRRPVLLVAGAACCLSWLAMLWLPWGPGLSGYVLFGVIGLATAAVAPAYAAAKELARPAVSGMAIALVNTALFLGAALMQPAFGWAMDWAWNGTVENGLRQYVWADYRNGLWLSFAVSVLGMLGALTMRETHNRHVGPHGTARVMP
ncbi:MAG: MFS transporter [Nevskiales bacterium]